MDKIKIGDKIYYSMTLAVLIYDRTPKTLYDWVNKGTAEIKKIGSSTFIRKL